MPNPTRQTGTNVLLVVLDSVRARNCSRYGYRRETTPYLSQLASEATTYTQARAPSNWSLPSHVSMFTGTETHEHGVTVDRRLETGHTVFERLADAGHATGLFTENGFLAQRDAGIAEAFETVVTTPDSYHDHYDSTSMNPGPDGFYYADRLLDWVADRSGAWAACLNLMDAHRPFEPRDEYDRWGDERARELQAALPNRWEWAFQGGDRPHWQLRGLERLYDGGVRQDDAILRRVVETLRDRGALAETLLVVCGDHGDGFGEPGALPSEPTAVSHIVPMHESLLHVPLVVKNPGQSGPRTVHDPAALTRFHDVALAAGTGRPVPMEAFAADVVVSSKQPVTGDLLERYRRHCESPERYTAPSRAVYVADGSDPAAVRKHYYWGEDGATLLVHEAGVVRHVEECDPKTVDAHVATRDGDLSEPRDDEVDPGRTEQLAALGYY